ncbi:MAG: hypothetical protein WBG92_03740 [Thiohalocapsa sp.]
MTNTANERYGIRAKSSSEEPYLVEFILDGSQLTVFCDCRAGIYRKLCKHKTELLAGDAGRLFDESEQPVLEKIHAIAQRVPELVQLSRQINESQKIIKAEQAKVKKAKKTFEVALNTGVEVDPS